MKYMIFPWHEFIYHPISDIGVIVFLCLVLWIYLGCRYKKVRFIHYFIHHIKLSCSLLLVSMILARPLITYYEALIDIVGSLSIIGMIVEFKWHYQDIKDHKKQFNVIPYKDKGPLIIGNEPLFVIKNKSGKKIKYLKFNVNISEIKKLEDNPNSKKFIAMGFRVAVLVNKTFSFKLISHRKYFLRENTLYKIVKDALRMNHGECIIRVKFLCLNNYRRVDYDVFYYYGNNKNKSHILDIQRC